MREIFVNDGMTSILLGRKGENEATKITFDIADWIAEYPQATFALINQKPNSTTEYPLVISQPMDGKVSWVVGGNELLVEGYGQCTLEAVEGNVVAKRHIWRTRILTAMGEPGEFPEPWESWLTEFTRLKGEAEDAQEAAEDAAEDSEAWAVGQRGGVDVDDEDPTYHNNSKYYSEAAQTALDAALAQAEAAADAAETAQGKAEDAQEAAEDAQEDAEAAQAAAELAKSTAETAASTATTAAGNAATSASAAASSASAAASAKTAAQTAQSAAATSAAAANTARAQTENLLAETITAKNAAVTAQDKAEDAQDAAEDAQAAAEAAQTAAEAAEDGALVAQGKAEDAQEAAEAAQGKAEDAQEAAETAQGKAEDAQEAAEEAAEEALETVESKAPAIYEEVSGEIVSIADGADGMLVKKLTVAIDPVQDLHGYDSPWPAGGGVNRLAPASAGTQTDNSVTVESDGNGKYTVSGTATGGSANITFDLTEQCEIKSGDYLHFFNSAADASAVLTLLFSDNTSAAPSITPVNRILDLSNYVGKTLTKIKFYIANGIQFNATVKPMLCSSSTAVDWSPYRNICPISGWTGADVSRTGVNVWDEETTNGYWNDGSAGSDSNYIRSKNMILLTPNKSYYFKAPSTAGNLYVKIYKDKNFTGGRSLTFAKNSSFTMPDGYYYLGFSFEKSSYGTTYNHDISINYPSTDTQYHAYSGSTAEYTFPEAAGTVYGGTLTIHQDGSGELVVDRVDVHVTSARAKASFSTDAVSIFPLNGTSAGGEGVRALNTDAEETTFISNLFPSRSIVESVVGNQKLVGISASKTSGICYLTVPVSIATTQEEMNAWLSVNEMHVVCNLITPVTYQLTNQQVVSLLKGNNVCFADCGSVLLEYPADTKIYIDKQLSASRNLMELIITANHEDSMQATKAYASGDLLIVNGTLYKATTSIANGATITAGTNVTATTVANELATLA